MIVTIAIVYSNFKISLLRWLPRTPALLLLLPGLKLLPESSGEAIKVIQNHSSYIVSLSLQIFSTKVVQNHSSCIDSLSYQNILVIRSRKFKITHN